MTKLPLLLVELLRPLLELFFAGGLSQVLGHHLGRGQ